MHKIIGDETKVEHSRDLHLNKAIENKLERLKNDSRNSNSKKVATIFRLEVSKIIVSKEKSKRIIFHYQ